jgi:hypothetical protein
VRRDVNAIGIDLLGPDTLPPLADSAYQRWADG